LARQTPPETHNGHSPEVGIPAPVTVPVDQREIRGAVLRLAWPSIVENILQSVLTMVTFIMVGQLGSTALAAVGASQQIQILFISAFFALSMGATVIIAHAFGAGRHEDINVAAKQSTAAGTVLSIVITVIVIVFAEPMLAVMGAEPEVIAEGARFQQISAIGYVFMAIMFILGGALRGVGDTRTPMLVTAGINVLNVVISLPLIFGLAGMPRLETDGAAIGQTISRFAGAAIMVAILYKGHRGVCIAGREGWAPDIPFLRRLADISLPNMAESLLRSGGQILFVVVVFMLGTAVAAGHQIAQTAFFLSMFPGFGFSMAATALVGQSLGAGNIPRARSATLTAARGCLVWMSAMGVIFFLFAEPIIALSATGEDKDAIMAAGIDALRVIALAQPVMAIGFVVSGALRGAGDTRFPMYATGLGMWVFRLPLAYFFAITLDLGIAGVYLGMFVDQTIVMGLMIWRYRQGKWVNSRLNSPRHARPAPAPALVAADADG
jgi:putative MATE family efflux protein